MRLPVDADKHLVQVPAPVRIRMALNTAFPDLCGEHRTEPVPPETNGFMADIDATLKQQILNLSQRERMYIITVRRIISGELLK